MKLGDTFASFLHANFLKSRGFKKKRLTFFLEHDRYSEFYQIQGSSWNSPDRPWTCYLNCGIYFDGIPARTPNRGFPGTHAWMRAGRFVPDAPSQYDISDSDILPAAASISDVISLCSSYFARRHQILRDCYNLKRYRLGFLDDPELQSAQTAQQDAAANP